MDSSPNDGLLSVRVVDSESQPITNARILFVPEIGEPVRETTDDDGLSVLLVPGSGRLVVTARDYEPWEQNQSGASSERVELARAEVSRQTILVRARDAAGSGIASATVLLALGNGEALQDVTDDFGFARFSVDLSEPPLEGELTILSGTEQASRVVTLVAETAVLDTQLLTAAESVTGPSLAVADGTVDSQVDHTEADGWIWTVDELRREDRAALVRFTIRNAHGEARELSIGVAFLLDTSTNTKFYLDQFSKSPRGSVTVAPGEAIEAWGYFDLGDDSVPRTVSLVMTDNGIQMDDLTIS